MLPTTTLKKLKKDNNWCGDGRRVASCLHRLVGRPEKITAYDVVKAALKAKDKRYFKYYKHQAIDAAIRLMDVETGKCVIEAIKGTPRTKYWTDWGYNARYVTTKRSFPKNLTHGHQIKYLLDTVKGDEVDKLKILLKGIEARLAQ